MKPNFGKMLFEMYSKQQSPPRRYSATDMTLRSLFLNLQFDKVYEKIYFT